MTSPHGLSAIQKGQISLGGLLLLVALVLSGPGVRVVRAAGAEVSGVVLEDVAEGSDAICRAAPLANSAASLDQVLHQLERDVIYARSGDQSGTVSLNNRGYNYGPAAAATDPGLLHFELSSPSAQ